VPFDPHAKREKHPFRNRNQLATSAVHLSHLDRAREDFYRAESLRVFSRATVPEGTFETLQDEVFSGVVDTGGGFENAVTFSTLVARSAARVVTILFGAVFFPRLLAPFPSRGWSPSPVSFKAAHI
jgi:hypothetical protein